MVVNQDQFNLKKDIIMLSYIFYFIIICRFGNSIQSLMKFELKLFFTHKTGIPFVNLLETDVIYEGPKYVEEGKILQISCILSRYLWPQWSFNNQRLDEIEDSRIELRFENGRQSSIDRREILIIENVSLNDEGFYRCNQHSIRVHYVHVLPKFPFNHSNISSSRLVKIMQKEFDNVELECQSDHYNQRYSPVNW